jgi:hypothetical protein
MKATYIIVTTPAHRSKYTVAKLSVNGIYTAITECRSDTVAKTIVEALNAQEYAAGRKLFST